MVCFCKNPMTTVPSAYQKMKLDFTPPKIPLALRIAAALPVLDEAERVDLKLAPMMQRIRTPSVTPASGPLLSVMAQLKVMGGMFVLDDIPMLRMQMQQTAASFNSHVLPNINMMASLKTVPLMRLAMIARLKLAIEPELFKAVLSEGPKSQQGHGFNTLFALKPPQIQLAKLAAGIPGMVTVMEKMKIPLGDPTSPAALQNRLRGLASLKPPSLRVSMPVLLKMCAVLEALGAIRAAFGPNAMTSSGLQGIAGTLNTLMRVPIPSPLPDLSLMPRLEGLPMPDDVKYGMNTPPLTGMGMSFRPPKLGIAPFLMAMVALRAALDAFLQTDPIRDCGACAMPVGSFA